MNIYISNKIKNHSKENSIWFSTVDEAKNYIRTSKIASKEDVIVHLEGGRYQLNGTQVFTPDDGGSNGHTVTYRAAKNEEVFIESVIPVGDWKHVTESYPLSETVMSHLYEADIPVCNGKRVDFHALYRNGKRLPCARSVSFSSREPFSDWVLVPRSSQTHFLYDCDAEGVIRDFDNVGDLRIHTLTSAAWQYSVLPLKKIDLENKSIETAVPCIYNMSLANFWGETKGHTHLENSVYFIQNDGDWAVDTMRGKVYLYSSEGIPQNIEAPLLTELVRFEGEQAPNGEFTRTVNNICLEGLTFTKTDMFIFPSDYLGRELQHAWDIHDTSNAMVRLRGAEHIQIRNCHFTDGASAAFRADLHAMHNELYGNLIEHIGMGGILFAGYGPGKLDLNRENRISNNMIREIGEIYYGSNGIFLWQSGHNLISHNRLDKMPYSGITISGRIVFNEDGECWKTVRSDEIEGDVSTFEGQKKYLHGGCNIIEYNDLSAMVQRLADGNGIYISGTPDGNVIRNNIVRDTYSVGFMGGIRMDDNQYGTTVEGNIIYNVGIGCGIENKQVNKVVNNYLVDLKLDDTFWFSYLASELAPVKGAEFSKNIVYAVSPGKLFYDEALYGEQFDPYEMKLSENLYYCENKEDWAKKHLQAYREHENESESLESNPGFVDAKNGDFRLRYNSDALRMGIEQIPYGDIGLNDDFQYLRSEKAEEVFVYNGKFLGFLQLQSGQKEVLRLKGRNKAGVPVALRNDGYEWICEDPQIARTENNSVVAVNKGKTSLAIRNKADGRTLITTDIIVSD